METIRFKLEGVFNSFRIPFFRKYHKSFLSPPKTTVIGMLVNIMGKSEKYYYDLLEKNLIKVSVVIDGIEGKAKDLWSYKTMSDKNYGRSIIRRDKLYKATYTVYLKIDNQSLFDEILQSLKYPNNIPSLGLDDEMVRIFDVQSTILIQNDSNRIDSVFVDRGDAEYKAFIKDLSKAVELPTANITPLSLCIEGNEQKGRTSRIAADEVKQIEFLNCELEVEDIESYSDGINRVVFY